MLLKQLELMVSTGKVPGSDLNEKVSKLLVHKHHIQSMKTWYSAPERDYVLILLEESQHFIEKKLEEYKKIKELEIYKELNE